MIKSFFYSLKQALVQLNRNKTMALTSLFSITAMLLILGMFFILVVNVNLLTESAKDQFDMVEVYMLDDATDDQINTIMDSVKTLDYTDTVEFLDKDDAMDEMKDRWGDNGYLLDGLQENPLPRSIRITLKNIEDSQELVDYVSNFEGIEKVKYNQSEINKILKITNSIQVGALVIIVFLIFVSIIVVSNTVKLTVLARGREISIMKYVGATNWFIRGPFLIEGIIIGILAALISAGVICGLYSLIIANISEQMLVMFSTGLVPVAFMTENLIVIFLALGVSIGAMGSMISMRRFLDT
ncbi:MAG: permease-like cell division protein FtsX [Anaerovoracaceae bacterium]|nr:permease-like cell division protein FtsX [Bacillota bacterium]MDD7734078.1 permease-like cell division protein FtsX [Bacillota bacterium]MDY5906438.1 permease-like cell division protein FtsX [Anaerovoracaceae bacterium]